VVTEFIVCQQLDDAVRVYPLIFDIFLVQLVSQATRIFLTLDSNWTATLFFFSTLFCSLPDLSLTECVTLHARVSVRAPQLSVSPSPYFRSN
jgi:hypothetical protein